MRSSLQRVQEIEGLSHGAVPAVDGGADGPVVTARDVQPDMLHGPRSAWGKHPADELGGPPPPPPPHAGGGSDKVRPEGSGR